jgi:ribosome-associated toxin RatA of RatAB toxin-antitoxin module
MATVQESITVDVPVRQAYNQWTQFEDFPNFMSGVDAVRQLDDTTVHFETSIAGVKREYDAQITVQEPDQRVTWESLNEPRNAGTVWFESLGANETKVNVELTWEPESAMEKLGAATGLDSRQVASDLRKFKKFIEERDTETGAWRESVSGGEVEGDAGSTPAGGWNRSRSGRHGNGCRRRNNRIQHGNGCRDDRCRRRSRSGRCRHGHYSGRRQRRPGREHRLLGGGRYGRGPGPQLRIRRRLRRLGNRAASQYRP